LKRLIDSGMEKYHLRQKICHRMLKCSVYTLMFCFYELILFILI
jgi:hypothetical protein